MKRKLRTVPVLALEYDRGTADSGVRSALCTILVNFLNIVEGPANQVPREPTSLLKNSCAPEPVLYDLLYCTVLRFSR